jgi:hypothetical protein
MTSCLATTTPAGDIEDILLDFDVVEYASGRGAMVALRACEGYGDAFFGLVVEGKVQSVVWLPEGELLTTQVVYDPDLAYHPISVVPLGDWPSDLDIDLTFPQFDFVADKGRSIQIDWDAVVESVDAYGDSGQFSGWNLTGLSRYANTRPVPGNRTQGKIDLSLTTSGGVHTLTLSINGQPVAAGSRTGNGLITLIALNNSGLGGVTTLNYSADFAQGAAFIVARWALEYEVHIAPSLNFPRAPELAIVDPGRANRLSAKYTVPSTGTYAYLVRAITDTSIVGNAIAAIGTVYVPGRPNPPGKISYVSGNWQNTVIEFLAALPN